MSGPQDLKLLTSKVQWWKHNIFCFFYILQMQLFLTICFQNLQLVQLSSLPSTTRLKLIGIIPMLSSLLNRTISQFDFLTFLFYFILFYSVCRRQANSLAHFMAIWVTSCNAERPTLFCHSLLVIDGLVPLGFSVLFLFFLNMMRYSRIIPFSTTIPCSKLWLVVCHFFI